MKFVFILFITTYISASYSQKTVIHTATKVYLVDDSFRTTEAIVIQDHKVIATGELSDLRKRFPEALIVEHKGYMYPGFIDAHCHFFGYAKGLSEVNLMGTKSEAEIIKRIKKFVSRNEPLNGWIIGRGWDQNDWSSKQYPTKELLDKAFPNIPVFLSRVDGHAAWLNSAAINALGFKDTAIIGGEFIMKNGNFTGIAIDNAADWLGTKIPKIPYELMKPLFKKASETLSKYGITAFAEAGLEKYQLLYLLQAQEEGLISQHIYAMLAPSDENFAEYAYKGPIHKGNIHIGAFKFYFDGALGSRGALLKHDYCDRAGHKGLQLTNALKLEQYIQAAARLGFQICVHAIGDSAQKQVLDIYLRNMSMGGSARWRVEHAQITDLKDFSKYVGTGIIPSVQPTHATSDAPWAFNRICGHSRSGAYAYKTLLDSAGIIALGTDFPVEQVSPFNTFYSSVTRKDAGGQLKSPFLPEQALSREATLKGMTTWAAYAMFEEYQRGSLTEGHFAEFMVLNKDLMTCSEKELKKIKVVYVNHP